MRARNGEGLWGPWSRAWSFVADGTARAVDVRLDGRVLRWSADGAGRTPARYRVYASDEQGFSVSDEPYSIAVGRSKEISSNRPANFVAETEKTELVVLGPGASNKAFYRVVAVDASGARSGPSDYAAAPRPYFTGEPCGTAKVGAPYRGEVSVIRSLGDLRLQWVDEQETPGFWDVETPRFAIEQGPSWLTIGARTGALAGTPDTPGAVEVAITATLERSVRRLEDSGPKPWNLGLGKEKTLGVAVEPAGTATLRFRIVVSE